MAFAIFCIVSDFRESHFTVSKAAIPLLVWSGILFARPGTMPFFTNDLGALRFFRIALAALSLVFLYFVVDVIRVEYPRVTAKRLDGVVVGLDISHPNRAHYAYPIIEFTDESGVRHTFSDFRPETISPDSLAGLRIYHVGDPIKVYKDRGEYRGDVRDEANGFWHLIAILGGAFIIVFSAFVSVVHRYGKLAR